MIQQLLEYKGRIKPITEIAIAFGRKQLDVYAIQDIIFHLQMAVYWLEGAADMLYVTQVNEDIVYSEEQKGVPYPETPQHILTGTPLEQLEWVHDSLHSLARDIVATLKTYGMEYEPKLWLENGFQVITQAKFSTAIAGLQYERLQSIRGNN